MLLLPSSKWPMIRNVLSNYSIRYQFTRGSPLLIGLTIKLCEAPFLGHINLERRQVLPTSLWKVNISASPEVWVIDQVWGQDDWILARFFFCVFMDRDKVEVNELAKKERGQYPAILTKQTWSRKDLLYGFRGSFSCGIQRVVPSGQDGSILPARGASQIIRVVTAVWKSCLSQHSNPTKSSGTLLTFLVGVGWGWKLATQQHIESISWQETQTITFCPRLR